MESHSDTSYAMQCLLGGETIRSVSEFDRALIP